jgi:molybdopterin/thiamine biosynthesis adenylyltransferase
VKHIIIFDGDYFVESNLNRQILCTEKTIGCNKAKIAALRVKEINSKQKVSFFP